ncbi:MAG TPA: hypothetical protein VIF12_05230, partial [Micavibrio sp.]
PIAFSLTKWREALFIVTALQSRLNVSWPYIGHMRALPGRGVIVAVTGIDGSGKSSIVSAIESQWRRKIDVKRLYFGTGDGPKSLLQSILLLGRRLLKKRKPGNDIGAGNKNGDANGGSWPSILWALSCGLHKRSAQRQAAALCRRGAVIVCDRFPQNEVKGMNDGPMLSHLLEDSDRNRRLAARIEAGIFASLEKRARANLILKLNPSLDVAIARKPGDCDPTALQAKLGAFESIAYPGADIVRVMDADDSFDGILLSCKSMIWGLLENASPRLVECLGLPGSGKTTTVNVMAGQAGIPVMRAVDLANSWKTLPLLEKSGIILRGIVFEFPLWLALVRFLKETESWKSFSALKIFLKMPFQRQWVKHALRANTLCLDQWLTQSLWSALLNAGQTDIGMGPLASLICAIYRDMPVSFVVHDLSPQQAAQRIAARTHGKSRFDGKDVADTEPRLADAAGLMNALAEACEAAGFPVEKIDAAAPAEDKAGIIRKALK